MIKRDSLPLCLLVIGIGLLAASIAAPMLFGGRLGWDDRMARQLQSASQQYHHAMHAHQDGVAPELNQARDEFIRLQGRLDGVENRASLIAVTLRWVGIAVATAGGLLHFLKQSR